MTHVPCFSPRASFFNPPPPPSNILPSHESTHGIYPQLSLALAQPNFLLPLFSTSFVVASPLLLLSGRRQNDVTAPLPRSSRPHGPANPPVKPSLGGLDTCASSSHSFLPRPSRPPEIEFARQLERPPLAKDVALRKLFFPSVQESRWRGQWVACGGRRELYR